MAGMCLRCGERHEEPGAAHLTLVLVGWLLADDEAPSPTDPIPLRHWMRHCCRRCGFELNLASGTAATLILAISLLPALAWLA
jgi:hypothetical protein